MTHDVSNDVNVSVDVHFLVLNKQLNMLKFCVAVGAGSVLPESGTETGQKQEESSVRRYYQRDKNRN